MVKIRIYVGYIDKYCVEEVAWRDGFVMPLIDTYIKQSTSDISWKEQHHGSIIHYRDRRRVSDGGSSNWSTESTYPFFSTIEFRIFDMPATIHDTIALAALCQALVAKLTWLNKNNLWSPMLSCHFIEENKWHAMRSGLDAEIIDFAQGSVSVCVMR